VPPSERWRASRADAMIAPALEEPVHGRGVGLGHVAQQLVRQRPVGLGKEEVAHFRHVVGQARTAAAAGLPNRFGAVDEAVLDQRGEVLAGARHADPDVVGDLFDGGVAQPPHGVQHDAPPHRHGRCHGHACVAHRRPA